jgi:beta-lactamase regulating signal transducer with metallopeptidase domain
MASLALPLAAFIPGETIVAGLLKQLDAPIALQPVETTRMEVDATGSMAAPVAPVEGVTPVLFTGDADALHVAPVVAPAVPVAPVVTVSTETQPLALFTLPESNCPTLACPLLAIWLGVAAFLLFRTGRDLLAVERLVARARPADLPQALQARMKGVRVVVSPEAPGPMAAGLLRPCIVLPESIALASPGMAGLLEHEHAHIRRRDMLAALGQRIALALLWWSPALYWISRRMDEEREVACDEAAVDRTGDAKAFARSLTKQAENQLWVRAPRLAVGAIGPRSHFGRRVRRLIDIAKTGGTQTRYSGRIACAGLVLAVGVAAMVTPRFTAEAQPPASDVQGAPGDSTDRTLTRTDRTVITLDGGNGDARSYSFSGADGEFAALGAEIEAMMAELQPELQGLMAELGPELESLMGELTPELQAEMAALGVEMSALGIDIAGMVSQDVISDMPQIMAEVRRSLEEAGIDPDSIEGWDDLQDIDVDMEEMRRAIAEAREELAQTLGPELKAEIRAALADARADLADARAEMADHHMEIANAMSEGHLGLEIARHALAAARDEIAAARANGELNFSGRDGAEDFGADLERTILDALRAAGVPVDGEGVPRPLAPPQPPAPLATPN